MNKLGTVLAVVALAGCTATLGGMGGTTGGAGEASSGGGYSGGGGAPAGGGGGGAVAMNGGGGGANAGSDGLVGVDGPPSGQWALFEREAWQRLRSDLSERVVEARRECGGSMLVSGYAFETLRGQTSPDNAPWGIPSYAAGACPDAVHAIRDMCVGSEMQKQSIRAQVQRVECSWGTPGVTFRDGVVYVSLDNSLGTSFYSGKVTEVLMANLH